MAGLHHPLKELSVVPCWIWDYKPVHGVLKSNAYPSPITHELETWVMGHFRNGNSFVGNSNSISELPTTGWKRTIKMIA